MSKDEVPDAHSGASGAANTLEGGKATLGKDQAYFAYYKQLQHQVSASK